MPDASVWRAIYGCGIAVPAVVDGAYLTGVGAIITAVGGIILGVLAYRKGESNGSVTTEAWRLLAEERSKRIDELEAELAKAAGR